MNTDDIVCPSHSAGFFSCTTIRLLDILHFINDKKRLPKSVDGRNQYRDYKTDPTKDITGDFFAPEDATIPITIGNEPFAVSQEKKELQFTDYKKLNYQTIIPIVRRYFSPSQKVTELLEKIKAKYGINPENTCAIRYRGNDKFTETTPPSYRELIDRASRIKKNNPHIIFFVQTDELNFLHEFLKVHPKAVYLTETPRIARQNSSTHLVLPKSEVYTSTLYYVAAVHLIASCKYVITTSGNGELWMCLYRGNATGVFQYLQEIEYIWGVKNESYDPSKKYFWL